jgi:deoxyribose-phosphate aldolase
MDTNLLAVAREVLLRAEARPPSARAQLLACAGGLCLLRGKEGLREVAAGELPADLDLSPLIDHTLLKADARGADVDRLCAEAREHAFASVCVNPLWVPRAAAALQGSPVRVCTVVGFPLGAASIEDKAAQARIAILEGAAEVDMVLAIGAAKDHDWDFVRRDYAALREAAGASVLKVILETCLLDGDEKVQASRLAAEAGLDFVKTSTGFSAGGATREDVALMRGAVGSRAGVKASGGIRDYPAALGMVLAGATRLGVSASLAIVKGAGAGGDGY